MRRANEVILLFSFLLLLLPSFACARFLGSTGKIEITPDFKEPVYLAGFGAKGNRATGVLSPLYASGVALSDGEKTVIFLALDLIGLPRPYVEKIRDPFKNSKTYILVASIHTHAGPDTIGLWGPRAGASGVNPRYMDFLVSQSQALIERLLRNLEPAEITFFKKEIPPKGLVRDIRDPVVIDNELAGFLLKSRKTKKTLGALIKWSAHPEVLGSNNALVSSDYVGYLRDFLEKELGGACAFFVGAIGGLLTADEKTEDPQEAKRIGEALARETLVAYRGKTAETFGDFDIRISSLSIRLPIENILYLALLDNVSHGRSLYTKEGAPWRQPFWFSWAAILKPLMAWLHARFFDMDLPWLESEVNFISLGPVSFLAVPGELFPELYMGGYKGEYNFNSPIVSPSNTHPPRLDAAPPPPYIRDFMPGVYKFLIGLANDEVGYIVPEYDFKINKWSPFLSPRPKGHHYEETNSLGQKSTGILLEAVKKLLRASAKD